PPPDMFRQVGEAGGASAHRGRPARRPSRPKTNREARGRMPAGFSPDRTDPAMTRRLSLAALYALALAAAPAAAQPDFPQSPFDVQQPRTFWDAADATAKVIPAAARRGQTVKYQI